MSDEKNVIVGVSCRLPKIDSLDDLWNCLVEGKSVMTNSGHRYIKQYVGGFVNNIENFDANFFNISPREAKFIDPQMRILLQKVHHAVENSTLSIKQLQKLKCGVFITALPGDYKYLIKKSEGPSHFGFSGNSFSSLSGRISFFYNLNGPSVSIDTACSSGLYALQLADLNLKYGQCEAAIVGGVTLFSTDEIFHMLSNAMIYSKNGACLPFCKDADGLVPAEACVCIVLTKASIAAKLNLSIYAEIESIKVNHDGYGRGFMCPNAISQANLLEEVYSDIDPNQLAYLETHGTGTIVGDEVEIKSLQVGIESRLDKRLTLGASKALLGHSLVTSGLVSVVKAVLCFKNSIIPRVCHLKDRVLIDSISRKFRFNTESEHIDSAHPIIGVNAFGFTGSNGHVVLRKSKTHKLKPGTSTGENLIFPVSAQSSWSLLNILKSLREAITFYDLKQLESVLQNSLNSFRIRMAFVAPTAEILRDEIDAFLSKVNEKSKILNRIINPSNYQISAEKFQALTNWIVSGDDELFGLCKRDFDDKSYRLQYPFHERPFWIDKNGEHNGTCCVNEPLTNDKIIECLKEYLSFEEGTDTTQISWLKNLQKSSNHIILLPPLNGDYRMWFFQIRKFTQEKFQLHIPFYPHHGQLSKKPNQIDFEKLVDEMYEYINYLKRDSKNTINVIGWSIGGCFASMFAIRYPNILDKLCLVSTAANFSSNVFECTLDVQSELNAHSDEFQIIYDQKGSINELLSAGTNMMYLKFFYDFLRSFDISHSNGLNVPCLIISGRKDVVISQTKTEEIVRLFHAERVKFPNDGHFIPLTNPNFFNDIVLNFFRRRGGI